MKDFFKKTWVKIAGWVCIILGTVVLFLGGTGVTVHQFWNCSCCWNH